MSAFPNDLEIVSEFAQQDLLARGIPSEPVQPEPVSLHEEIKIDPMDQDNEVSIKPSDPHVKIETVKKEDAIDAAIEKKEESEGYESSDLEISSDEEESSEESQDQKQTRRRNNEEEEEEEEGDQVIKTAHEIVDFVIEKPDVEITPTTPIVLAGTIYQVIDNVIVIHARTGSELSTLDQGSLLVYENRQVLGEVFETFGPVVRPYYSVRFNTAQEIDREWAVVGAPVFYVPSYQKTHLVEVETLKRMKGSDASNMYDEEVGEEEMEFSDDEKEMEHKRQKKAHKRKPRAPQPRQRREVDDFDAALANYPVRQPQSYADLFQEPTRQPQQYDDLYNEGQVPQSLVDLVSQGPPPSLEELERQQNQ
ncbi:H/ACA ribonucleoprotein complex non-core subunit NAF1 [Choanephora cucurbitarum]|uniref:H/ACA ribonucleoprotein complex non-core subunit NAF1 n=1 Tax=Choanephora cucurbitarum TaxID=101091 RepID=A0A1C7NAV0_9FUNG|nr:H/ACA ribonucleoprotein complex non-core subunit NAF1 [Choanephora cucurbitarum]